LFAALVARTITVVFPVKVEPEVEDELPPQPVVKAAASPMVRTNSKRKRLEISEQSMRGEGERMGHPFKTTVENLAVEG
jgi:hypothetical protein